MKKNLTGRKLIGKELAKNKRLENKRIFLFHEPYYFIENMLMESCLHIGFQSKGKRIFVVNRIDSCYNNK